MRQQAGKMAMNVPGTLEDRDPEYLHDLRVATRRLRSAVKLFAGVLGARRCERLRADLGWLAGLLGDVRDLDVFIRGLREQTEQRGAHRAIVAVLTEESGRQRGPARKALEAALASRRFRSLMRRLEALAASPPPRRPRAAHAAPVVLPAAALIRKAQQRVLRLGRTISLESSDADLHRLRIRCKRLRYTCEFFREVFTDPDSGADPLADHLQAMARFQDCLGEHQDAVVAVGRIQQLAHGMVQREPLLSEQLLDVEGLIRIERGVAQERRRRLAKLWARFDRRSVRKVLKVLGEKTARVDGAE